MGDEQLLDADGPGAPPRRNGELVFAAPWESRLFGLTISLYRKGLFEWDDFRSLLIEEISDWEQSGKERGEWSYYERWQAALERLLAKRGILGGNEVDSRTSTLADRPAGHDH